MLIFNKDPRKSTSVRLEAADGGDREVVNGLIDVAQYSGEQYKWDPKMVQTRMGGLPRTIRPYARPAEEGAVIDLPPYSITVVTMEE